MNPILSIISIVILISLYKASTAPKVPQSPAACGIGFFIATAGIASWQYLLSILPSSLFLVGSVISIPLLCVAAGYISARTTEDTSSMNAKIVAGVAFIPFVIVTLLSLSSLPSWVNYYAVAIFVPCIMAGLKVQKMHNKSSKKDVLKHASS
ncbi:MAG: hypothetical protein ACRBBW_21225 [Cellvibrionaceae bacterium]